MRVACAATPFSPRLPTLSAMSGGTEDNPGDDESFVDAQSDAKPKRPKMGVVLGQAGSWMIRKGGKPDVDWTRLVSTTVKRHPYQLRNPNLAKQAKDLASRTYPKLSPLLKKNGSREAIQTHLIKVRNDNGWEALGYLRSPDPSKADCMIDAFLTPDVFTNDMAKTRAEVKRLAGKYDETDKEDDQEFRSLILDCMEPSFRREFEDLKQQDDPAILTWLKVVRSLKVVTYKQVLALQQEVQTCDIRSFPGQDVQQAFSYLSQRVRVLKSMGEYNPLDLVPFLNTLSGSVTTEANKVKWWSDISRDIVQPLEKQSTDMKMVQRLSLDEVEDRLKDQNLDFDSVQDALTDMYLSFV